MPFRAVFLMILCAGFTLFPMAEVDAQDIAPGSIIDAIVERGTLRCGVNASLPGFGAEATGEYSGFDIDVCRAVAAAVLGDADAVEYVPLAAADRALAFEFDEIDMLSRNTTWTLSRVAEWNVIFGPTTFYDGQSVMVRTNSNIGSLAGLAGARICVPQNTTSELNIRDTLDQLGVTYELVSQPDTQTAFEGLVDGTCDAFTTDKSGLAVLRTTLGDAAAEYTIFEDVISAEPLGPVSPAVDPQFAEVIRWVVFGMIEAEERGISQTNVESLAANPTSDVERFLGLGGVSRGDLLGIPNDFMYQVILQVGNYAEVYERHLGPGTPLNLERGANRLYDPEDLTEPVGLLYAPPFR
jgi:general L-amino acid transport system substrate-binding protein